MRLQRLLCAAGLQLVVSVQAANLSVIGGWSETIGSQDLAAGAGTNIRSPIDSGGSQAQANVADTGGGGWTLHIGLGSLSLPAGVTLAVRRSSDGSGPGGIAGGEAFVTVTDFEQPLCSGSGDRSGIGIQLRLNGVSISQGPGSYGGTLTYRID